jgi:hypothetical protein
MKNVFLVFGYGVPKNIFIDENYNLYLKMVFNKIYNLVLKSKVTNPLIICSGGKTDCFKPYKRNEGEEMVKFFKKLSQKSFLKPITTKWLFISEKTSLSTLENFLHCKQILKKQKIVQAQLYIFCEQTRAKRVKTLAKKILDKKYNSKVIPIDFDTSPNRYLDPEFLAEKERMVLKHDLWALKNSVNLKKYHTLFEDKLKFLRKAGPKVHTEAVKKWWEQGINKLMKKHNN